MFLTISYISNVSEKLMDEDIEILFENTKIFNDENDIKGVLIYSDHTFFQIIEGEYHKIRSLYERINKDDRHYGIFKIFETKSSQQKYSRFNSNYVTYNRSKANTELLKFFEISDQNIPDKKLYDLIVSQSKVLLDIN